MKEVTIYTDGACKGNPGPGGFGVYIIYKTESGKIHEAHHSGGQKNTTNNQMELLAAIEGLKMLKESCTINLYTDSKYVMLGITEWIHNWRQKNWRKSDNKPVKNADLWRQLDSEMQKHQVRWHWVKGHSNCEGNNIADKLASDACYTE